jgi:hypothetical protein
MVLSEIQSQLAHNRKTLHSWHVFLRIRKDERSEYSKAGNVEEAAESHYWVVKFRNKIARLEKLQKALKREMGNLK